MGWGFSAAGLVVGIGSSIFSGITGSSAAKKARKAARKAARQAAKIALENELGYKKLAVSDKLDSMERERTLYWEASKFQGANRATVLGMGMNDRFGSAAQAAAQNATSIARDAHRLREASERQTEATLHAAKIARMGGQAQAAALRAQGNAAYAQGIGNVFQSIGNAAQYAGQAIQGYVDRPKPVTPTPGVSGGQAPPPIPYHHPISGPTIP